MNFDDLKTSKYLAGKDLPDGGLEVTIAGFEMVTLKDGPKVVMTFREAGIKPMIVNMTNRNRLTSICGSPESRNMVGHRVQLYFDKGVEMAGELVGGLRIRPLGVMTGKPAPTAGVAATVSPESLQAALAMLQARADQQQRQTQDRDPFAQDVPF